jgi:hypothetical protein
VKRMLLHATARRCHVVRDHHADAQSSPAHGNRRRHGGSAEDHNGVVHGIETDTRVKSHTQAVSHNSWTKCGELGMVRP